EIAAITSGVEGADWSDMPSTYRTSGLTSSVTRAARRDHFRRIARFAQRLGERRRAGHVGQLPADTAEHRAPADAIHELAARRATAGQVLSVGTGQEPAQRMASFLSAVHAPNLTVNFDPVNFVLYGNGAPASAWGVLRPWVDAIHC